MSPEIILLLHLFVTALSYFPFVNSLPEPIRLIQTSNTSAPFADNSKDASDSTCYTCSFTTTLVERDIPPGLITSTLPPGVSIIGVGTYGALSTWKNPDASTETSTRTTATSESTKSVSIARSPDNVFSIIPGSKLTSTPTSVARTHSRSESDGVAVLASSSDWPDGDTWAERGCSTSFFEYNGQALRESGAIEYFKDWSNQNNPGSSGASVIEYFVRQKVGEQEYKCSHNLGGCVEQMTCTVVARGMAGMNDDNKPSKDEARRVYFLILTVHHFFQFLSAVEDTRDRVENQWSLRASSASEFFTFQHSDAAEAKCKSIKDGITLAMTFIAVAAGVFLGSFGGVFVPAVEEGVTMATIPVTKMSEAVAKGSIAAASNAIAASISKVTTGLVDQRNGGPCGFVQFQDTNRITENWIHNGIASDQDQTFSAIAKLIDSINFDAGDGKDQPAPLVAVLANIEGNVDEIESYADYSRKLFDEVNRGMTGTLIGRIWGLQRCFIHCIPGQGQCKTHDGPMSKLEFCPESEDLFCQAQCWVSGHGARSYPIPGVFKQAGDKEKAVWKDDGKQGFVDSTVEMKNTWGLDVSKIFQLSVMTRHLEIDDPSIRDMTLGNEPIIDMAERYVQLPVAVSTHLKSLPNLLDAGSGEWFEHMPDHKMAREILPFAIGEYGKDTYNFVKQVYVDTAELNCTDGPDNSGDKFSHAGMRQIEEIPSIHERWIKLCVWNSAVVAVRFGKTMSDVCQFATNWALNRKGRSSEAIDHEFCSFTWQHREVGETSNVPWGKPLSSLSDWDKTSIAFKKERWHQTIDDCQDRYPELKHNDGPVEHDDKTPKAIFEALGKPGDDDTVCGT
ncbi:MAG: hypothetical protein M1820_000201 [Bogoriella megaspora]|nr:MAG: hypothetical protein M1820_000201 [Bogoriella megaspora]